MNKLLLLLCNTTGMNGLAPSLASCGFEVKVAPSEAEWMSLVEEFCPDAVVVNGNHALSEGSAACQRIRDKFDLPLILVGSEPEERLYLDVCERGASWDYYMRWPVDCRELVARLKVLLWRYGKKARKAGEKMPM